MGVLYVSTDERDALNTVDPQSLENLIDACLDAKRSGALRDIRLDRCGAYVATKLRAFEQALGDYAAAKADKKVNETEYRARRAGGDLAFAVAAMKRRVEAEDEEGQRFHIDDVVAFPDRFTEHLSVSVGYRWRATTDSPWQSGSITFVHDVDVRPNYSAPAPRRKPTARQQEANRQEMLSRTWEHLMATALFAVRDFLREGGKPSQMPAIFKAQADPHYGGLNNESARFWSTPVENR